MILTDRFVMLNFPRTGSTFVRSVLRQLHRPWWGALGVNLPPRASTRFQELTLPIDRSRKAERLGRKSQHGRWGQIPESHRHLPVATVIRHPLDHAVSSFWHADWWKSPPAGEAALLAASDASYEQSLIAYRNGLATFVEVDEARRGLADAQLTDHQSAANVRMALSRLALSTGELLREPDPELPARN